MYSGAHLMLMKKLEVTLQGNPLLTRPCFVGERPLVQYFISLPVSALSLHSATSE